jgi:hypothetical protein
VNTPRGLSGNLSETRSGWRTILLKQHLHENCTNNLPFPGSRSFDGLRRLETARRRDTHPDASRRTNCTSTRTRTCRARSNSCDDSSRAARLVAAALCREWLLREGKKIQQRLRRPRARPADCFGAGEFVLGAWLRLGEFAVDPLKTTVGSHSDGPWVSWGSSHTEVAIIETGRQD